MRAILAPYTAPAEVNGEERVALIGPEVSVGGEPAASVALVLHELATNAVKYGALSAPSGRVSVSWSIADRRISLSWKEAGGPPVTGSPSREGFGSVLARRSVERQLGGNMVYHWNPGGLEVVISLPSERLTS